MNFDDLDYLAEDVLVVGTQHYKDACTKFYNAIVAANEAGVLEDEIGIRLQREPDNLHDSYAVKVFGKLIADDGGRKSAQVGFLHRSMAFKVGENTEEEDKLYGEFVSIEPHVEYGFDIRINVLVKYAY